MWAENVITTLPESQILNRSEILNYLLSEGENISKQSLCWLLDEALVLFIEKDLCSFTFDFLNERYPGKVLYNLKAEDIGRYKTDNSIILTNAISEAQINKENPHDEILERLLVDCVADKTVKALIPSSEISNIFENSKMLYSANSAKTSATDCI